MPDHSLFRLRALPRCVAVAISGCHINAWADEDIQFDSRFLELKGDTKIDLKRFSSGVMLSQVNTVYRLRSINSRYPVNMIFTGMQQKMTPIRLMPVCRQTWRHSLVLKKTLRTICNGFSTVNASSQANLTVWKCALI